MTYSATSESITPATGRRAARHATVPGLDGAARSHRPALGTKPGRRRALNQKSTLAHLWDATPKVPAQRAAAVAVAGVLATAIGSTGQVAPLSAAVLEPASSVQSSVSLPVSVPKGISLSFSGAQVASTPAPAAGSTSADKTTGTTTSSSSDIQAINDPAAAQAYAASQLAAAGWGADQMGCLTSLWNRESGWRTTAENPSSLAYGIAQSLPAEKMASAGADYRTNYKTQINWGFSYIKGRYGSPCGAWGHSQATGWY
ncbi:transglycosylase [Psychromicrobium xiongbiense]|uniref:aggregation-promoting factor C-terminal-like domain-containing protein n=1 Tax=Psychromicrobium xiongbiense TaxID=3051184 RepID=UPI0025531CBE|nr:transglycosylase [Psychromicrobium sp. YIM S02556]